MTLADVISKFRYSVYPISAKNQDEVIGMIESLEKVKDVGRIARLLG
jgi:hypothetical protein